ncbi:MAG: L-seryl-tRNA(Sec) selenium transferase [Lentisphaeria bacterium]|nr:L-seryl-tRNA(Sec) selenium transferase [Candidatus Neomarinimicrobiota bacterium]MCF7841222.1 L-seryl-tRNA(Sec) selenium transferase [Lentisphaeria bacterium]
MANSIKNTTLKNLPSVDQLLQSVRDVPAPHAIKARVARGHLAELRETSKIVKFENQGQIVAAYQMKLTQVLWPLKPVINATGVILHTGLGRAPYSAAMLQKMSALLTDAYVNLELDLPSGKRGNRNDHLRPWLQALSGAENGILVNNNAAAVLLALNTLANRKEVIISRGQLVEIGGSFRIPEILKKAGAKLVEVGTTNRTHPTDFEAAISKKTSLLLWVHSSNYRIEGFTREVSLAQMVQIGRKHDIPVMADLGSGALVDLDRYGVPREPLVPEVIKAGVDVVTFSVDKLLGGPQGGVIVGSDHWIKRIEKNHLLRALRTDKTQILLTLEALRGYFNPESQVPFYRDLKLSVASLTWRAETIAAAVSVDDLETTVMETRGQVGSGASPTDTFPSVGLMLRHPRLNAKSLARKLRLAETPILGYIAENRVYLDLRTVRVAQDDIIIRILNSQNYTED